ncbi:MAG: 16S rRNA (cytosine(1402)-N(4))-methyltransferase RsmH [Eubacteriales bacterium]|nr:16S rRNA (cytosine(1402)-N(4))-methyltransferase RsmH [Eubacteriales bacterium]
MEFSHTPVLLDEVLENLEIKPNGVYVDCTLGGAGHSSKILEKLETGLLVGFDKDQEAIDASTKKLSKICKVFSKDNFKKNNEKSCLIIKDDFKNSPSVLTELGITTVDGILIDLGVSSHQLDTAERGFSFKKDAPLDMRMDSSQSLTAKQIVNSYSEEQLRNLFKEYGEEEFAFSIAKNICKARALKEIETTLELNEIIENSMPKKVVFSRGGAAKKVFQALRIEVNGELNLLKETIENLIKFLCPGGRIAIISFHSLEDRIVKNVFKDLAQGCICPKNFPICVCNHKATIEIVTRKPIVASEKEQLENSRSTCAKLRVAKKL